MSAERYTRKAANLLRELLLAQLIKREELPGQSDVVQETAAGQLDADDDLTVGHHHGDRTELDLEILWQLLPARVARVHGQEDTELGVHVHHVAIREDELLPALFLAREHDVNLLRRHGQHWQVDAVELVEAAPAPRLSQA